MWGGVVPEMGRASGAGRYRTPYVTETLLSPDFVRLILTVAGRAHLSSREQLREIRLEGEKGVEHLTEERKKLVKACTDADLPDDEAVADAIDHLRSATQVWLDGTAEAPFVYDVKWGGVVNCGCDYDDKKMGCR